MQILTEQISSPLIKLQLTAGSPGKPRDSLFRTSSRCSFDSTMRLLKKTAQGRRKAVYFFDFSASKDVFKGKGTINFNVLDVFNSRKFRSISTGPNFYTEGFQFRQRQINLTFSYRIRQAKPTPKKETTEEQQ